MFKKNIFEETLIGRETPSPFMANAIKNFHFFLGTLPFTLGQKLSRFPNLSLKYRDWFWFLCPTLQYGSWHVLKEAKLSNFYCNLRVTHIHCYCPMTLRKYIFANQSHWYQMEFNKKRWCIHKDWCFTKCTTKLTKTCISVV